MNKNKYWEIILEAVEKHPFDEDSYYEHVQYILANLTYKDGFRFSQFTEAYLHHADCPSVMMLCKLLDGYVSDDTLLYFTLWVISRGKDFYLTAILDPDNLAENLSENDKYRSFEFFMSLGLNFEESSDDFSDKEIESWHLTKEEQDDISAEIKYLNKEKSGGYGSVDDIIAAIPNIAPQLADKFGFKLDENDY